MRNEYTITKKLMKSWAKGWYFNSIWNTAFLIFVCIGGVFFFIFPQIFSYYFGSYATKIWYICHSGALFLLLYIPLISSIYANQYNKQYKINSKNYCVKKWKRSVELMEDEIIVDDEYSVLRFEYSAVKRVKERRRVVQKS